MSNRIAQGIVRRVKLAILVGSIASLGLGSPSRAAPAAEGMAGTITNPRSASEVSDILHRLRASSLATVPEKLFGRTYNKNLADLIVYIDRMSPERKDASIALVSGGKTRKELRGARHVWALLLVAGPQFLATTAETTKVATLYTRPDGPWAKGNLDPTALADEIRNWVPGNLKPESTSPTETRPVISQTQKRVQVSSPVWADSGGTQTRMSSDLSIETKRDTTKAGEIRETRTYRLVETKTRIRSADSTSVRLEALGEHRSLGEAGLALGLGSILGITPRPTEQASEDRSYPLPLQGIGSASDTTLYVAMYKFPLKDDTVARLRVVHGNQRAYKTFGNYGGSRLGGSVGILAGTVPDTVKSAEADRGTLRLQPYLFFDIHVLRPTVPRVAGEFSPSIAITGGTELKAGLFENLFLGVSIGHLLGDAGIVVGFNHRRINKEVDGRRPWNRGFAAGFKYSL